MTSFIEMKSKNKKVLIEISQDEILDERTTRSGKKNCVTKALDESYDEMIKEKVVEQCQVLNDTFENLRGINLLPSKVTTEFGLQFNSEGNLYVAKVGAQANLKLTLEWEFERK